MILVTGSSGVLGSALLKKLSAASEDVVALTSREVDLRDEKATLALFQRFCPKLVYHVAARVHGIMGNKAFPAEMFVDNIKINTSVVEAALRVGVSKFVAVSTVAAYPDGLTLPITEDSIWCGVPHGSERYYGHAKRTMLAHLESYHAQCGFDFSYAIVTNLYGPNDRFDIRNGHVIPSLIAKFHEASTKQMPVSVWGGGRAKRDFLYADDAAEALLKIAVSHVGAINVASGVTVPISQLVDMLSDISGVKDILWDSSMPEGQLDRSYDVTRLRNLGCLPRFTLQEGLRVTYDWYARNYPSVRQ